MIDWSRVDELRQEIGDDGFAEVVELFLDEVEEVVARLAAGTTTGLEGDLHFLKGSAWNLGFADFGALCQDGEKRARTGGPVDLTAVTGCYGRSKLAFLTGLRQIAAGQTPSAA